LHSEPELDTVEMTSRVMDDEVGATFRKTVTISQNKQRRNVLRNELQHK